MSISQEAAQAAWGFEIQDGDEISDRGRESTILKCTKYLHPRALQVDESREFNEKVGIAGKLYAKLCTCFA